MSGQSAAVRLYTPEILSLAIELSRYPLTDAFKLRGAARSRSCGSTMTLGLRLSSEGLVDQIGIALSACAIGQASAALFARRAMGQSSAAIAADAASVGAWLAGENHCSIWPDLAVLDRARNYPARHDAILLPWNAAQVALSKARHPN